MIKFEHKDGIIYLHKCPEQNRTANYLGESTNYRSRW